MNPKYQRKYSNVYSDCIGLGCGSRHLADQVPQEGLRNRTEVVGWVDMETRDDVDV
jgi:hypothetical protein